MELSNFTAEAQILSRVPRHLVYISTEISRTCYTTPEFHTAESLCNFVRSTEACVKLVNIFNYLGYLFCALEMSRDRLWDVIMMYSYATAMCTIYLFIIYVVGRYFIQPNLLTLCEQWGMLDYHFGVTIVMAVLMFPDLLYHTTSCKVHGDNGSEYFVELLSDNFLTFTVSTITFCLKRHWHIEPFQFCVNTALMTFGQIYLFQAMLNNVATDHFPKKERPSYNILIHGIFMLAFYLVYLTIIGLNSKPNLRETFLTRSDVVNPSMASDDYYRNRNEENEEVDPWDIFFDSSNIFRNKLKSSIGLIVLMAPIWFVVSFLVPVLTTSRPLNGWCKFQTVTSLILFPFLFYYISNSVVYYGLMMICLLCAILTIIGTSTLRIPRIHFAYGLLGIMAGLTIHETLQVEVSALIYQILSFVSDWDVDANVIVGKSTALVVLAATLCNGMIAEGHQKMAYGSIVGVTMFNTYCALALLFFHNCHTHDKTPVLANVVTTYYFLIIVNCVFFLGVCMTNFEMRWSHGIALLFLMLVYILFIILSACNRIHPFGSQHSQVTFKEYKHADWA